jgi:hypothetical protein
MSQLDKTFPTNDCSMCIISPKLVEAGRHLNIDLYTMTDVKQVTGEAGNFTVTLRQRPRFIDHGKLHGLRRMQQGVPHRRAQRLRPGPARPQSGLQTLPPGHAIGLHHREKGNGPLQGRLPGQPQFPGLRRPDGPGQIQGGLRTVPQRAPLSRHLRPDLPPPLRNACTRAN